jgi:hypothetical protein
MPDKSGVPSGILGAGPERFGVPSALRGIPGVGWFSHCAASGVLSTARRDPVATVLIICIVGPSSSNYEMFEDARHEGEHKRGQDVDPAGTANQPKQ